MYSIWLAVICAILMSAAAVHSEVTDCETKFTDFMEKYKKCFTTTKTVLTKPIFYKLQELYNKEITEEDFVQYKIENCPRLNNGILCVLAIDVTDEDRSCPAISGILDRFQEENISYGYICDLDNQQFLAAISDGGLNCLFARGTLENCMKNRTKTYDGVIGRCEALKIKKACLATVETTCANSNLDTHLSAIIDALQNDLKCEK